MSGERTIAAHIKVFLKDGPRTTSEIHEGVPGKNKSIDSTLSRMVRRGDIERLRVGFYGLGTARHAHSPAENLRGEAENAETINKMLNLYDTVLDNVGLTIVKELRSTAKIAEKVDLIKSLRWLGATVDQLMKRWYLVHRGYDSNTRQAQEDAKAKARQVEKEEVASLPPEERVVVVGEYDDVMKVLWDDLPESEKARQTV